MARQHRDFVTTVLAQIVRSGVMPRDAERTRGKHERVQPAALQTEKVVQAAAVRSIRQCSPRAADQESPKVSRIPRRVPREEYAGAVQEYAECETECAARRRRAKEERDVPEFP